MQGFTFDVWCLGDHVKVNYAKSKSSTSLDNPITREHIVATRLCFMGEGYINSLKDLFVFFNSSTEIETDKFLDAVEDYDNPRMGLRLPDTFKPLHPIGWICLVLEI